MTGSLRSLRATADVDQLASFGFAAARSTQGLRNLFLNVRPDKSEY